MSAAFKGFVIGPRLGVKIGERMLRGVLVPSSILDSLSTEQLAAVQRTLQREGMSLPSWYLERLSALPK